MDHLPWGSPTTASPACPPPTRGSSGSTTTPARSATPASAPASGSPSVTTNIAYPLRIKKVPRAQRTAKAAEVAARLGLTELLRAGLTPDDHLTYGVRPEYMDLTRTERPDAFPGVISVLESLGTHTLVTLESPGALIQLVVPEGDEPPLGTHAWAVPRRALLYRGQTLHTRAPDP
ncbi:TOBE domain-containing protein [Nonomuraea sp. B12E4]|uniref:TOBE domain-containing protein n=1 Tax=Nonomuraea sp. B12E4 TaxID=3153564 RepID=UPI00325ED93C